MYIRKTIADFLFISFIIPSIITLFGIKKIYKYDISKLSKGDK